jgi:hypothetical protein
MSGPGVIILGRGRQGEVMRLLMFGFALVLAAFAFSGCGGEEARTVTVAGSTAQTETTTPEEAWLTDAVNETLAEYELDIAKHCLAVAEYRAGQGPMPADDSFRLFAEAVDGIISIARAEPTRMIEESTGTLTIGDWMMRVADNAALCDQPGADRLRYAAETL